MIANITKGKRAAGALIYDFGPGHREEHVDARFIAGNVPGTRQQVARLIDHHTRQGELTKPLWRCSLSLPDEDGVLPDAAWSQMAEQFINEMGFADCPWVAVRHGDDHIHLTVSRLAWDGTVASDQWDYARARKAADAIEAEHGLVAARSRFRAAGPGVRSGAELAASVTRGQDRPEREQIRDLVRAARDAAAGGGRPQFEQLLTEAGVLFRANVASTGRMNGYSFSLPGWASDSGPVWVTASSTAKDLAWKKLGPVLGDGDQAAAGAAPAQAAPDLARQQLDRYRSPAPVLPDVVPEPEPLPFPPLDQRRYGRFGKAELANRLEAERTKLPYRERYRDSLQQDVERVAAVASGSAPGERAGELDARLHALRQAVGHLDEAARQQGIADEESGKVEPARSRARAAEAKSKKRGLWAAGTSKAEQERLAAEAWAEARAAQAAAGTAYSAIDAEKAAARAVSPQPRRDLAELEPVFPQLREAAVAEDLAHAALRLPAAREQAEYAADQAAQSKATIRALEAEQRVRAEMPADQAKAESAQRSQEALKRRAAAASSRSPGGRGAGGKGVQHPRPPQPPSKGTGHDRGGPSR